MHTAILISEVLDRILDYLAEETVQRRNLKAISAGYTTRSCRQALAAIARTCRALSEPALDALWRRLHGLEPFLRCLPTRVSHMNTVAKEALTPFSEEEWNIVSRYAPRVRELTLDESLSLKILESSWFHTTLLLPNLRKLHWTHDDHTAIASIRMLLSPSLVHLHVWFGPGNHTFVLGLLKYYHQLCPNLKSLCFRHSSTCPHVLSAVSHAIFHSPHVETLICDRINEAALLHVAKSHRLKVFSANLRDYPPDKLRKLAGLLSLDHTPFENVRVLKLDVQDLSSLISFLKTDHQPFEDVSIDFHVLPEAGMLREFFTALGSATRQKTLRRIQLFSVTLGREETAAQVVDFEVLSPLTAFHLYEFAFHLCNPIALSDDQVARLAQAWPELEIFRFNRSNGWGPSPQIPTLRGLLLLVARCPKLHELGLCVDATHMPTLSADESVIRNMSITRLSLANSPIREPLLVARFLRGHFPLLSTVVGWTVLDEPPNDYRRMWDEAQREIVDTVNERGGVKVPVRCNIQ